MEITPYFESELVCDVSLYKEFTKINTEAYGRNIFLRFFCIMCILYLLMNVSISRIYLFGFLLLSLFYIIMQGIQLFKNKDGGLGYKQLLVTSNNSVPHQLITCSPEGITTQNCITENKTCCSFANIKYIMESQNLLVLVTDLRMCHIIDKRTLAGGSRDELIAFLRKNCPNMKKRIKKGKLGRFMFRAMWTLVALGCIWSIAVLLQIPERIAGQLTNDMSYQEMAVELEALDITISQRAISELEEMDTEYLAEYGSEYYFNNTSERKIYDLLYWEAAGFYDQETWEWTPSTSGLFWFDMEVLNMETIYTDFLTGVSAMHEELSFSNIQEDYHNVDFQKGTGTVAFSFDWNGCHYELDAEYNFDWFDTDILFEVGRILAEDACDNDLYFAFDGGQGYLLYYGNPQQLKQLERKSGLDFHDTVQIIMGH